MEYVLDKILGALAVSAINGQIRVDQAKKILPNKGNTQQREEATIRMVKDI